MTKLYRRHDWPTTFKQREISFRRGKHFDNAPHVFAQQVRSAAKKYGYRVSVDILSWDRIDVRVVGRRKI